MPRPPTDARDRLLATAGRLFYAHGIAATGIDAILRAAGVAKMTLYHHFGSKEGLAIAWLEQRHRAWMGRFTGDLERSAAGLPGLADALARWFADDDFRGCAFLNTVCEGSASPALLALARRHKDELRTLVRARTPGRGADARADEAMLVVEGAILRRQVTGDAAAAVHARRLLRRIAVE
jgi:AcrR family transcriptional regulator